jgi:hypothetical protein
VYGCSYVIPRNINSTTGVDVTLDQRVRSAAGWCRARDRDVHCRIPRVAGQKHKSAVEQGGGHHPRMLYRERSSTCPTDDRVDGTA